uniref:RING-type E3 ubiquitin transferase n=1 Tax=Pyramimonas orientalis virus TaxID=455367 RepID=A0A7M3UPA3_POV01|nr:hypothetical protein HWQ62_00447 [Pyramimonas orientalis virus]
MLPMIVTTTLTHNDVEMPTTPPTYERRRSSVATPPPPPRRRYTPPMVMTTRNNLTPRRLFSSEDTNHMEAHINQFVNGLPSCVDSDCECTICLSHNTNNVGKLPCGHTFHSTCITQWFLKDKTTCPNCRRNVDFDSMIELLNDELVDNEFETMLAPLLE